MGMSSRKDFSKKILKILAQKPAVSLPELMEKAKPAVSAKNAEIAGKYALTRSLKGLREAGLVEKLSSGQNDYARLTEKGRRRATSYKLQATSSLVPKWDGLWRIILLDLPESRKALRESLRYLLKKAGFVCLKNSVWVSPFPFEHLFENIKKDLNLTSEMIILTTNTLDESSEHFFLQNFKK